ncbi:MAG TPA: hypothetical protein VJH92_04765, partial [Candidatus Nanoarchaeia archaeon]|nr:hypothetical protein [Candidatus Nanoarchaeia archaeon]
NNALDGTSANSHTIVMWNPTIGVNDNQTDIIGQTGNSGVDNLYMIDCELLNTPCQVGDNLSVKVLNIGDNYLTNTINVTVTGAGFDVADNLSLNSPPNITSILIEDSISSPLNEIDLVAASNRTVICNATVTEYDGQALQNSTAKLFHNSSFYSDSDDNNIHYSNSSCYVNSSYGAENESSIECRFDVTYYANYGAWNCSIYAEDNLSISDNRSDNTTLNQLLSIGLVSSADYGIVNATYVSDELTLNVTNYGNILVNLSLSGYGNSISDGNSMICSGRNISINYHKYNLSTSTPGTLSLSEFEQKYINLSSNIATRGFRLNYRENDLQEGVDDTNSTYWRVYVPTGVGLNCQGNIVFGATLAVGS